MPMFGEDWEKRREGDEFAPSLGKVPILWDGDCVVWDSLAIIEFLADRVGRERYWPEDAPAGPSLARCRRKCTRASPTSAESCR